MLIKNVKIYTGYAEDEPKRGWVRVENGRFAAVEPGEARPVGIGEDVIDGEGLSLIPGLIDAHTHLGVVGDAMGIEGDDCNEDSEPILPQLRVIDGCNPFDRCFAEARAAAEAGDDAAETEAAEDVAEAAETDAADAE